MDIVEELRRDPENGAKRLEAEYKSGLMALVCRFCDDESDAAELVNSTFAAVVENIDDYVEQSAFFSWMCKILMSKLSHSVRRKSNKMETYPGVVPDVVDEDAQKAIYGSLDASLLRDAIETLPPDIRKTLLLHYFMDMPVKEVARVLSSPTSTITWRLYYARRILAAKLGVAVKKPGVKALLVAGALCALTALGVVGTQMLSPSRQEETRPEETEIYTGETTMKTNALRAIAASAAIAAASSATASEALFKNTAGDGDLANTANWDPSSWASDGSLTVSTANFSWPAGGLSLSADMPESASLKFGTLPNQDVEVDFAGRNLNAGALYIAQMHNDANKGHYLKAKGGFSGVGKLFNKDTRGHIRFYDGVYSISNGLYMYNWDPQIHVCSGAELVFENLVGDGLNSSSATGINLDGNASRGVFAVDGGKVVIKGRDDIRWRRAFWLGNTTSRSSFTVKNGGEYRDDTTAPANSFVHVNFTIKDAGYYETNSCEITRNAGFLGTSTKYTVTNSIFRVAQLYCGPYQASGSYDYEVDTYKMAGSTVDFCNSEETFAFAPGCDRTSAGLVIPAAAKNNTFRFRGDANRFTSQTFVLGGSNTVAVTGGRFDVSNSFAFVAAPAGSGSTLVLKDADAYLKTVAAAATSSNTVVDVSGSARVKGAGNFATGGPGSAMRVADDAVVDIGANSFLLQGDGSSLFLGGLASTGAVSFAANDCTVTVAGTTNRTERGSSGWTRVPPVFFAADKRNNVLVISNATYSCNGPAYKEQIQNDDLLGYEARPFTGCPGCRIEFRGSSPKFVVTSAQESESAGISWFSMAFGEMIDPISNRYTQEPYPLDNPVRLRYVIPPSDAPYAEAPLQSTSTVTVLGGNAEFEFDMSEYDWPLGKFTIPLVYDLKGFTAEKDYKKRKYINVEQLNETNASRMPVNKCGVRCGTLALSADGTTLNLVISNKGGMTLIFR